MSSIIRNGCGALIGCICTEALCSSPMTCLSRTRVGLCALSVVTACGHHEAAPSGSLDAGAVDAAVPEARSDALGERGGIDVGAGWSPSIDANAFGRADVSRALTVAAFSQSGVSYSDPQVIELVPDIVPRAWGQWDRSGLLATDYALAYPKACEAEGIRFVGGVTASTLFADEMSASDFADAVSRDATGAPVAQSAMANIPYRGALASPTFRQLLVTLAELQIDAGVDGVFFDEVNASYVDAHFGHNAGFDDHDVADFGRFLCQTHASDPAALEPFGFVDADHFDCSASDPGASFDYRGYIARHGAMTSPVGQANPLSALWGTAVGNRPDPSAGTFVETYTSLVYWQDVVVAVRNYARAKYGKDILITSNGIFPFVDFQSVGLYDYNADGPGPIGVDYAPVTGTAPTHYDGTVSFMPALATLRARSDRIVTAVGGRSVPVLLFLDWPTPTIDRYYGMPTSERQDYVRVMLAETHAYGESFALPLATTTDSETATALGMMGFFKTIRAFYEGHADLLVGARDEAFSATLSASSVASHVTALPDGRTVVHLVNHNYATGFLPQSGLTVTLPVAQPPTSVTVASPDLPADQSVAFAYAAGHITIDVGPLVSSAMVVVR
jgi:hypothetical protein